LSKTSVCAANCSGH